MTKKPQRQAKSVRTQVACPKTRGMRSAHVPLAGEDECCGGECPEGGCEHHACRVAAGGRRRVSGGRSCGGEHEVRHRLSDRKRSDHGANGESSPRPEPGGYHLHRGWVDAGEEETGQESGGERNPEVRSNEE